MNKSLLCLILLCCAWSAHAELEVISLQHRSAEDILPIVRPLLDEGGVASGLNNRLILRTNARNLAEIKKLLESLDSAPRRLSISVIQDVDDETVRRLTALSAAVNVDTDGRLDVFADTRGESTLILGAGNRAARVGARISNTRTAQDESKIQHIQVVEGGRAIISTGLTLPVPERQIVRSAQGTQVISGTQYREVNSGFYVSPRLNGDRVTLEISTQNDALEPSQGAVISVQQVSTTVSGRLGEWLQVGEITRSASEDSSSIASYGHSSRNEQRRVLLKVEELLP